MHTAIVFLCIFECDIRRQGDWFGNERSKIVIECVPFNDDYA